MGSSWKFFSVLYIHNTVLLPREIDQDFYKIDIGYTPIENFTLFDITDYDDNIIDYGDILTKAIKSLNSFDLL